MATKWKIDQAHSEIQFKVKHLMISTVTGSFKNFDLEVETEAETFDTATRIVFTANIDSITTNNEQRDAHLKSADFFNAEEHPQLRFTGKKYEGEGDTAKLQGDLTIKGITKPITLNVEYGGTVVDPYGQTKAGIIKIHRLFHKAQPQHFCIKIVVALCISCNSCYMMETQYFVFHKIYLLSSFGCYLCCHLFYQLYFCMNFNFIAYHYTASFSNAIPC